MKTNTTGPIAVAVAATAIMLIIAWAPSVAALEPMESVPHVTATGDASDLRALAAFLTETPGAILQPHDSRALTCGQSGHCNVMTCDIDCPAGQEKKCSCEPSEVKCQDAHNPYNPFDNDEHNMYTCDCSCLTQPPSEKCLVEVEGHCIKQEADDLVTQIGSIQIGS